MVSKGEKLRGWEDVLGVWDGNAIKLGGECTTINVINSLSNIKKVNNYNQNCRHDVSSAT